MPAHTASRIALVLIATLMPAALAAQAQLSVTVRDSATGEPIRNALVEIGGLEQRAQTNGQGLARLARIPAGNRLVSVTRLGYEPARIAIEFADAAVERTVRLAPEPVPVGGVTATGAARDPALDARGFYDRQRRGLGAFMTGERIDELRPTRTVDLFRYLRGFQVRYDRGRGEYYVVSSRGGANLNADCSAPEIYLDGVLVGFRANYFAFVNPENIAAIEAYSSPASIPVEYRANSACGVILIWTRTGPRG